jgi:hypothetical protein
MALLGAAGTMLVSGSSNPTPTGPGVSTTAGDQSLNPSLQQQVKDLKDAARQVQNAP